MESGVKVELSVPATVVIDARRVSGVAVTSHGTVQSTV